MVKRQSEHAREEELRRLQAANLVDRSVPKLPDFTPAPQLQTFGGEGSGSEIVVAMVVS